MQIGYLHVEANLKDEDEDEDENKTSDKTGRGADIDYIP